MPFIELSIGSIWNWFLFYWNDLTYVPEEHYCYVSFKRIRGILWIPLYAALIPTTVLFMIYFRITRFLRNQSTKTSLPVRHRQQRDLSIIKHILLILNLLSISVIPGLCLIIYRIITGNVHPLSIRIIYLSMGISYLSLNISMLFCIPQLKDIILQI